MTAGSQYDVYAWVRGELDADESAGQWLVRVYFADSAGNYLSYVNAAGGVGGSLNESWSYRGARVTVPSGAARMYLHLYLYMSSGWVAFDDVEIYRIQNGQRTGGNLVVDPGFEAGGWGIVRRFPGTSIYCSTWGTAGPHSGSRACSISNHAYGWLESEQIAVNPNTSYDLYAWLRGELDADDSAGQWIVLTYFYDSGGNRIGSANAAVGWAGSLTDSWQRRGGPVMTPANAASMTVVLYNYHNSGWFAFDDVTLEGEGLGKQRINYYYASGAAGGQRVAMRVQGAADEAENGLFYLSSDHQRCKQRRSTTVTLKYGEAGGGTLTKTAELRYLPWGGNQDSGYDPDDTPTGYRFTGQRRSSVPGIT